MLWSNTLSVPLKKLLDDVAVGKWKRDEDLLLTLAGRLGRLARHSMSEEEAIITNMSGGRNIPALANALIAALNPDKQIEMARQETGQTYLSITDPAVKAAAKKLILDAVAPFDNPDLREALIKTQQRDEQVIDIVSQDRLLTADWDSQAEDKARQIVTSFRQFLEQHRDEIAALEVFYSRSRSARLQLKDIKELAQAIASPPLGLSTDKLWQAYETLDRSRVRGGKNPKRVLADLIALIRYTIVYDKDTSAILEPYSETIHRRFTAWLEEQERMKGKPFTAEQQQWLEWIRDIIAESLSIETDDFDLAPFTQRGGLRKAYQLFGKELPVILKDLNERLAA